MKTLDVKVLDALSNKSLSDISVYLDKNLSFEYIDMLPWPLEYAYKPFCRFKMVASSTTLYIKYYVSEFNIRAKYNQDQEAVWEDSCVEFFCKVPGDAFYFNFEFNCIGTCLASKRAGKNEDIRFFSPEQLKRIERLSTLGNQSFDEKPGFYNWALTVGIPLDVLGVDKIEGGRSLACNFYKCGDGTSRPHYLSWNNIVSSTPNFHLPEFFGAVNLLS